MTKQYGGDLNNKRDLNESGANMMTGCVSKTGRLFAGTVFFWALFLVLPAQTVNGASTTLRAEVTINSGVPLELIGCTNMQFGQIRPDDDDDEYVILSPDGTVTTSNTEVLEDDDGPSPTPTVCNITGQPNAAYVIVLPDFMVAHDESFSHFLDVVDVMSLSDGNAPSTASGVGLIKPDGTDTIRIGGKLLVIANAFNGSYMGEVPVTIHY